MADDPKRVAETYFKLMHGAGPENMAFLQTFAPDAVLVEPFSGTPQTHRGVKAIEASFRTSWQYQPMPDFRIQMGRIEVSGDQVEAEWTCTWQGLPAPMKGLNRFLVRDGKIARLEITVTGAPGR